MALETYWVDKLVVVDWPIRDPEGTWVPGVTVTGTVTLPPAPGGTTPMVVAEVPAEQLYRATYNPIVAGTHAVRLVATGVADGAEEATFVVRRSLVGLPPITVDPTTDIGKIRLLATDLAEDDAVFEDGQISAFLAIEGNVKRAAALAIETIATSEALVSKVLTTSDGLTTDGAKLADSLMKRAKALRDQADVEAGDPDDYGIEIVDFDQYAAYRTYL
ncbi:hypothetical protein [Phytohabitans houttuyneae]|uniref:Uncharacterized protein n=1 Tax=Phytohabitans houttuyneae TaxID=1076126 RepID=A0A6V8K2W8_9ACTN|nr:hypothetical protein [Phytohabitans houttuyneae]GFJ79483.1 hypothetical protein Phou_036630 [Phytohabitans houttuyneae]